MRLRNNSMYNSSACKRKATIIMILGQTRGRLNCSAGICCNRSCCKYSYDQWCKQRLHRTTERLKVR